ncbi:hypothetical protein [Iningainema tapete]|uniref:Uncharacterized protein n=1 Tax=Iningainema tapete BLCC-T55 TaxID=2748662 RepID=A0A8J7C006_9CYAN|nr:hypothetical protein [Iningainema tapete]MBD2778862.1 hypothetical protein [Iningainema tapete BLCC-T55]
MSNDLNSYLPTPTKQKFAATFGVVRPINATELYIISLFGSMLGGVVTLTLLIKTKEKEIFC